MLNAAGSKSPENDRYRQLLGLITGHWISRALSTVVEFGVPDALKHGPLLVDALAQEMGLNGQALQRLLRTLASVGIFDEISEGQFGLTDLGQLLCSEHPHSLRGYSLYMGADWHWREWMALPHSIKTGKSAFEHVTGQNYYAYMHANPQDHLVFNNGMADISRIEAEAIVDGYDFSPFTRIMDAAGGVGRLLVCILKMYPGMQGVLLDLENVIKSATGLMASAGVQDRCELVVGDFYRSVPVGADACIIKRTLWSMDDEHAGTVLGHCHDALPVGGKILIIEPIITTDNRESALATLFDLLMLAQPGGRARTEAEYRMLTETAHFKQVRLIPIETGLSIVEGTA